MSRLSNKSPMSRLSNKSPVNIQRKSMDFRPKPKISVNDITDHGFNISRKSPSPKNRSSKSPKRANINIEKVEIEP